MIRFRTLLRAAAAAVAATAIAATVLGGERAAASPDRPTRLELGAPAKGSIAAEADDRRARFRLKVPEDAIAVRIDVNCPTENVDVYARFGEAVDALADCDHVADLDDGVETLVVGRYGSDDPLEPGGVLHIAVVWADEEELGPPEEAIPFTIEATAVTTAAAVELSPGKATAGELDPKLDHVLTYRIDVPKGCKALRFDVLESDGDVDLVLRHERPARDFDDDRATLAEHGWGREELLLAAHDGTPIASGSWFIDVIDMARGEDASGRVVLIASLQKEPPAEALAFPEPPTPADRPLGRALAATVEIASEEASGSGSIVTPDGLILTNQHVIEGPGGRPVDELVIALDLDMRRPPAETFRARVIASDRKRDLALIEITGGLYGQPLPDGYRLPFIELGDPGRLVIGDPLIVLGYPETGGVGSRVSITATRGIVSGFERLTFGTVIKTDAEISPGVSGGAAVDEAGRLVGLPTSVLESGSGQIGSIHPIDLIPAAWRKRIDERIGR